MSKGKWVASALALLAVGCLERELSELNPCLVSGVARQISVTTIDKVDLLFVVDNSNSMAEEQAALNQQFPKLIRTLTSGVRPDGRMFPGVKDLHLGVVSSDMGLAGIPNVSGCDPNGGDDGILQNKGHGAGCSASYPSFLSFERGTSDPDQVASDFACIASLGTGGCGIEQQLEAGLKALWPKAYSDQNGNVLTGNDNPIRFLSTSQEGRDGHGDRAITQGGNAGFLRNDERAGQSLVAIIVVSDEEDCSSIDTAHFANPSDMSRPLNRRCFMNKENLFKVQRYVDGFKGLRPGQPQLVIFGAIVGVPPDLVNADARARFQLHDKDKAQRDAYYDAILNDPRMQERADDQTGARANLVPSCYGKTADDKPAAAYPPVRIVQVAREFGANGVVQSICQEDFGPAMDVIIDAIIDALPSVCLPKPLVRQSDGMVRCKVIWELPPAGQAQTGVPTQCGAPGSWLAPVEAGRSATNSRQGVNCEVQQLAAPNRAAPSGQGWYYDDFAEDLQMSCFTEIQKQRVSFSDSAKPGNGVVVKLECLNETQRLHSSDPRRMRDQPDIGVQCAGLSDAKGKAIAPADACKVQLQDGNEDRSLFCHPELNVCVRECQSSSQCPPAWVCDTRTDTLTTSGGRGFCVNPTCGST